MIFLTHLAFGLLLGLLYLRTESLTLHPAGFLAAVLIASLIPDVDTGTSFFGRHIKPLNHFLEHRTFFHSILFMIAVAISAAYLGHNSDLAIAAIIGISSHIILDCMTPAGVYLFWPSRLKVNGPFRTASIFDMLLFAFCIAAVFYVLYLYNITTISQIWQ